MTQAKAPTNSVRRDRAVGAVLASAAGDALGAPHEFGPALGKGVNLEMTGGGTFGWAPGEWTDDTQTALAVLDPLSRGSGGDPLVSEVEAGLLAWMRSGPADVGNQTRAVLGAALRDDRGLRQVTTDWQARHPEASGNGSLMRTGPVALSAGSRADRAKLSRDISMLTHASDDAIEACLLWTDAIGRAIEAPVTAVGRFDWVGHVSAGLDLLDPDHRGTWAERLDACRTSEPEAFTPNGYVVSALQAALSALLHTDVPATQPCRHLRSAIERAVRIGDDTDTVAAITGSLAGAWWGATAVPLEWRRTLNGRLTYDKPTLVASDLDRSARLAHSGGADDPIGWPSVDTLLPYYDAHFPATPLAAPLTDQITVGNVHALAGQLDHVDVVVSLCRMGRFDVPEGIDHQVIGLLDTHRDDNPNLSFVLADTADYLAERAREGMSIFVHCVRAENRTPAVAAAYLVRAAGIEPDVAIEEVHRRTRSRPQAFLAEGVRALSD